MPFWPTCHRCGIELDKKMTCPRGCAAEDPKPVITAILECAACGSNIDLAWECPNGCSRQELMLKHPDGSHQKLPELSGKDPKPSTEVLLNQRGSIYGPIGINQDGIGQMWKGILEHHFQKVLPGPIPAHVVALMFVAVKVARAAVPTIHHQDNFDDMHGYVEIADKLSKEHFNVQTYKGNAAQLDTQST